MAKIYNVYEAKAQLSKLIDHTLRGEEVIIARANKPLIRLVPWQPAADRTPGAWKGKVRIAEDFDEFSATDEGDWYGESR